jgi:hypothetical protein
MSLEEILNLKDNSFDMDFATRPWLTAHLWGKIPYPPRNFHHKTSRVKPDLCAEIIRKIWIQPPVTVNAKEESTRAL